MELEHEIEQRIPILLGGDWTTEDVLDILLNFNKDQPSPLPEERVRKILSTFTIEGVKERFNGLLQMKDDRCIEVVAGAYVANKLEGDPVWLLLVAPSSSTKTEILSSLRNTGDVVFLASMTPQTLISGKRDHGKNQSLLLREDFRRNLRILVMKDFTTVLSMRSEMQNEILAQLREVYDGQYSKAFGTGELIDWEGKIGFIGGVTYVVDKHLSLNQLLGERFLYYRIESDDRSLVGHKAKSMTGKESSHRTELRQSLEQFLSQFQEVRCPLEMPGIIEDKLVALADLCTLVRTAVPRDKYTRIVECVPQPEGPGRMTKQLYLLGSGIGIVNRKKTFDEETYDLIKKVAIDSVPGPRSMVVRGMWENRLCGGDWRTTSKVAEIVGIPPSTSRLHLEDMMMLGIVERRKPDDQDDEEDSAYGKATKKRKPYNWQLSEQTVELIEQSGVFEDT